ncbi:MAG TPA: peptide chain release factor N(5)-glutamine methyltransferase [Anaerolineaceae bacterium]|nr:peptide chain release factor N(5)-glutamine methyltransferase [Anaerolineaceae bacterium]
MDSLSTGSLLKEQAFKLSNEVERPYNHALVLLSHILGESKSWVLAHPDLYLSQRQISELSNLTTRLTNGEPLPYLTGKQAFFGLDFKVDQNVLIPRPETELMVEEALTWLKVHPNAREGIDLGTGSGCVAISLVLNCPELNMCAVDISAKSLLVAMENAIRLHCEDRIRFTQSDLFKDVTRCYNMVCANLPYIPTEELAMVKSLPYEPRLALDGGKTGLELIERSMIDGRAHLQKPFLLLYEFQFDKASEVEKLAEMYYPLANRKILKDLAGLDRILRIEES